MAGAGAAGVVLVHGAWHGAWCWEGVVAELDRRGVPATAVELPFTGFADDVAVARQAVEAAGRRHRSGWRPGPRRSSSGPPTTAPVVTRPSDLADLLASHLPWP